MKRTSTVSYELTLVCRPPFVAKVAVLKECLLSLGVGPTSIVESRVLDQHYLSVYSTRRTQLEMISGKIKRTGLKGITFKIKRWVESDWKSKWKQEFVPFRLTKHFTVVPAWMRRQKQFQGQRFIYIDNAFAFGTGQHPTTRFLSELIEEHTGDLGTFLDVGTGTGILAILAAKKGTRDILAVDLDRYCVRKARENIGFNDCSHIKVRFKRLEKLKVSKKFDFLTANLSTFDLMKNRRRLCALVKTGKYLAVSGISVNNYHLLKKEYKKAPLRCIKIKKKEGWVAILFRKK